MTEPEPGSYWWFHARGWCGVAIASDPTLGVTRRCSLGFDHHGHPHGDARDVLAELNDEHR